MARFLVQFSYTAEAWQTLMKAPEDRSIALASAAQSFGGKLISLDYCFGDYDGVVMLETPDDVSAGSIVLAAMGGGHLAKTKTTKLISIPEAMDMMSKAGSIVYATPRG